MSPDTDLVLTAGVPFERTIRVVDGRLVWASLDLFEVRSQVRAGRTEEFSLLLDLTQYMTTSLDGDDILIDWVMTGADTRSAKSGYYDVQLSDVGQTDAVALPPILHGRFTVNPVITSASDL